MSILVPSDVVVEGDGLTEGQRQDFIDRSEALVAARIGFTTRQASPANVFFPDADEADIASGGVIAEDDQGELITDTGDTNFGESPLGAFQATIKIYPVINGNLLELPQGPVTAIDDVKLGDVDANADLADLFVTPWSVKWQDPRRLFFRDVSLELSVRIGFVKTRLPARIKQAILATINLLRFDEAASGSQSNTGGGSGTTTKTGEQLGPFKVTFAQSSTTSSGSSSSRSSARTETGGAFDANKAIDRLVAPWKRPRGLL